MRPRGVLEVGGTVATLTPDGWLCADPALARTLAVLFAPTGTEVGDSYLRAFHQAARELHARVAEPWPEDASDGPDAE